MCRSHGSGGSPPSDRPAVQVTPPPTADDLARQLELLRRLGELHSGGVLSDAELAAQKAAILAG